MTIEEAYRLYKKNGAPRGFEGIGPARATMIIHRRAAGESHERLAGEYNKYNPHCEHNRSSLSRNHHPRHTHPINLDLW